MKKAFDIRLLAFRIWFLAAVAFGGAIYSIQPVLAQTAIPTASAEKVDQLIKLLDDPEIRALLNKPAALPAAGPATNEPATEMSATAFHAWGNRIREHLRDVGRAIPQVPSDFMRAGQTIAADINGHGPFGVFVLFLTMVLIGLGAEWLFYRIGRRSEVHAAVAEAEGADENLLQTAGRHLFALLAPLVAFSLASLGLFMAMTWPPLLDAIMLPLLLGVIACRFVIRIARVLLVGPSSAKGLDGAPGLVPIDRAAGVFWYKRIFWLSCILFAGWAMVGVMEALSITPAVRQVVVYALGLGLLLVGIETVWNRPAAIARPDGRGAMEWALTFYLCLLWALWVAGLVVVLWLGIYALILPGLLKATTAMAKNAFAGRPDMPGSGNPVVEVLVERGAAAGIITLAVLWLAFIVNRRSSMFTGEAMTDRIIQGVLAGAVILLVADILWQIVKVVINRTLEQARTSATADSAHAARNGRLLTLLPLLRTVLAVVIGLIAILMVLSGLGVQVGPLIAGAGIFGVAIGFGSQTLVKDVISGVFYMMDDAFRVGEYIQSGSYKGTVESFSIRSVRLRHHRGPVFTVPFGTLGAVQNMSRDWVIDKFTISVGYDTDINKVRKMVKGVGAALLEDEEYGSMILETLKMKGVEQFGDYGINLSFAMMTKPGYQTTIRRKAYMMIREAFTKNGVVFASPTVQVASNDASSAAAAAATVKTAMDQKKLAEGGEEGA
ncbi:mechanosensitive ion channel family protein [Pararhizobium sp. YC-54]|uniref:mechanosensitive ion channel family protein n=1 Tax=Pararhizobium sp. YC-54 TaxID=2986920 RepID=UPI0021F73EA2|nr:mechanosensitive ion channel family protein [Pararhizobium sp. YC-54]MCW0000194.1 mechanosensitive ion channel family protein [Pararhizobium sp. YC-54]